MPAAAATISRRFVEPPHMRVAGGESAQCTAGSSGLLWIAGKQDRRRLIELAVQEMRQSRSIDCRASRADRVGSGAASFVIARSRYPGLAAHSSLTQH